jgi:hypothetical protein
MKYFALFAISLAAIGSDIKSARAGCDSDYVACMASCGSAFALGYAICQYNCGVEVYYCKKNPNNASAFYYGGSGT